MRILAFADAHLPTSSGGVGDILREITGPTPPDIVLFCGDLTRGSGPVIEYEALKETLALMMEMERREIPSVWVEGNHRPKGDEAIPPLGALQALRLRYSHLVVEEPAVIPLQTPKGESLLVLAIPYHPNRPQHELLDEGRSLLRAQLKPKQKRPVVVGIGHLTIDGARCGKGLVIPMPYEEKVKVEEVENVGCDIFFMGHIHFPQKWGNVAYCGALENLRWGDCGAGYWVVEKTPQGWRWKRRHSSKATLYREIQINYKEQVEQALRWLHSLSPERAQRTNLRISFPLEWGGEEEIEELIQTAQKTLGGVIVASNNSAPPPTGQGGDTKEATPPKTLGLWGGNPEDLLQAHLPNYAPNASPEELEALIKLFREVVYSSPNSRRRKKEERENGEKGGNNE
jgi:DNA repair exonuclease SbcCD nuclease subunit